MSKAKVYYDGQVFKVRARFIEVEEGFPGGEDSLYHNVFRIIIDNGQVKRSFGFYSSHFDYLTGKTRLSAYKLIEIFKNFLQDSYLGSLSFEDFCKELGYSKDRKSYRIWKSCKRFFKKAKDLGIEDFTWEPELIE